MLIASLVLRTSGHKYLVWPVSSNPLFFRDGDLTKLVWVPCPFLIVHALCRNEQLARSSACQYLHHSRLYVNVFPQLSGTSRLGRQKDSSTRKKAYNLLNYGDVGCLQRTRFAEMAPGDCQVHVSCLRQQKRAVSQCRIGKLALMWPKCSRERCGGE